MFRNIKDQLDNPVVRNIFAACVYKNADKKLEQYRSCDTLSLYGWVENGEIVGVCGFEVRDTVEIKHIAVAENARGRGIGSAMIAALRAQFCLTIQAETDDDAVDFYRKVGFEATEFEKYGVRRWACVLASPISIKK